MIRPFTFLCFCAFAGAGAWLYQVKHQVATYDRELRDIRRQIEQARDRTTILRAEWALLNEPDRLRQVATRHLPLEPMQPQQFARLPEMERRLPTAVAFAGAPNLFAPPEPVRGSAPVMLAAAQVPAPTTRATPAPVAAPAPSRPAPEQRAPDPRAPESPAVQALAAAVAAQRASQTRPAPTMPPRPAPLRDVAPRPVSPTLAQAPRPAPAPIQQAAAEIPMRDVPVRRASAPAPAAPSFVSALGGGSILGRPMLAPPVPISSAVAATLDGRRDLPPPQSR